MQLKNFVMRGWKNSIIGQKYKSMGLASRVLLIFALLVPNITLYLLPEEVKKTQAWKKFFWQKLEYSIACKNKLEKEGFYEASDGDHFFEFYYSFPNSFYAGKISETAEENLTCYPILEPSNVTSIN